MRAPEKPRSPLVTGLILYGWIVVIFAVATIAILSESADPLAAFALTAGGLLVVAAGVGIASIMRRAP